MKYFKATFLATLFALFCHVASAQPVVLPSVLASTLASVNQATNVAFTSTAIPIRGGARDITIWQVANTSSGTGPSNSIVSYNISFDGTNFTTTYPFTNTVTLNGNTNVCSQVVILRTNLAGTLYIRPDRVSTTQLAPVTNSIFVTFDP